MSDPRKYAGMGHEDRRLALACTIEFCGWCRVKTRQRKGQFLEDMMAMVPGMGQGSLHFKDT